MEVGQDARRRAHAVPRCILLYPGVSQRRTGRAMCEGVDTCIVVYSVCILMYSILGLGYM